MKENILVAFSGGRTSGFMSWWLKEYMSHLYNFIFVYANTGLEHEKTLQFVDKCDKFFDLDLVWLEAKINKKGEGTDYNIVSFETACTDNRLFSEMCSLFGLPNSVYIHCTRELKLQPMNKYGRSLFGKNFRTALGIRHDEFRRVRNNPDVIYPLATITKITKQEILEWWGGNLLI